MALEDNVLALGKEALAKRRKPVADAYQSNTGMPRRVINKRGLSPIIVELTYQSLGSADTRVYGYDANGNLTSLQSLPQVANYGYDALDRLISDQITSTPASSQSFGYDANGNRTSDNSGIYTYTSASNRLTQTPQAAVTLDAAGNTLDDGQYTYSYNQDGHLAEVKSGSITLATYTYNHQRQRTRKVTVQGATIYHYDLAGNLIVETTSSGSLIRAYVWADNRPIAQISAGVPETLVYLHADHLGTPRLATNGSGTVVWSWEGEAFGGSLPNEDPDGDTVATTINLRFPGQYHDGESGLFYGRARYYDPASGRWLTPDRMSVADHVARWQLDLGVPGQPPLEINSFAYVANNPLRWMDPTGLAAIGGGSLAGLFPPTAGNGSSSQCLKADRCEEQLHMDEQVCRGLRDAGARARCWSSANERYGACRAGRPLPPLVTWKSSEQPISPVIPIVPMPGRFGGGGGMGFGGNPVLPGQQPIINIQ